MEEIKDAPLEPSAQTNVEFWCISSHMSVFLGLMMPVLFLLAPLAVWLYKGKENIEIERHAKESLNFQITMFIFYVAIILMLGLFSMVFIAGFVGISTTAFIVSFVAWSVGTIFNLGCVVVASIAAYRGHFFRYPFNMRWIK